MNAPVNTKESKAVQTNFADYKATIVAATQTALSAMETPVPWCARSDAFQSAFYDAKQAAYDFITTILDRLIAVPGYMAAQDRVVTDNLFAASTCYEMLSDEAGGEEERKKAAAMLRVQTDTVYFSLNNACGKVLNLHGNLYYYKDTLSAAAVKLQELADVGPVGAKEVDPARVEAVESHKQHLAAQLRAASWRQVEAWLETGGPIALAPVEIAENVAWAQLPFLTAPVMAGDAPINLDDAPLGLSREKLEALYTDLTNMEKSAVLASATAGTISALAVEAREVLACRLQVGNVLETITGHIDLAMGQCVLAQSAITDGDYRLANYTLKQLAGDWHAAVEASRAIAVDLMIHSDVPLAVGMTGPQMEKTLKNSSPRGSLTA